MNTSVQSYKEMMAESHRRLQLAKPVLVEALKSVGIVAVEVEYDGEGDSGQIDDVTAVDSDNQVVDLRKWHPISIGEGDNEQTYDTLAEFIEEFAWDLLGQYHDGFENNEGGYGTLTIDVPDGQITIDHNDRFVEVTNTETEF